ncbi:ABC transporter ATP-binding protein [Actinokineospora pegani]|uniref:ABC transporter ATP-binding protein n=1 Tax=Actinokineospora pegani TaxID=2654637 RepID=UPI0012EAD95B|nr:ABC transporter ATP-binding protein [Actinokineospora pegani]
MTRASTHTRPRTEPGQAPAGIEVRALGKYFTDDRGDRVAAVDDITLTVRRGEFLVLLGPSGCGKTTLLRCLAGLETPDTGAIDMSGRTVFDAAAKADEAQRQVGMVFQSYALWPHMTVEQNIAYPLTTGPRSSRPSKPEVTARVQEMLALMRLTEQAQRRPGQLSGGQQQRVALARAIAAGNDVVLFDEPLSNIDAKVREALRLELRVMQRKLGFTAVYVTHDQTEALELADRIAIMRDGKVVQLGTPEDIYRAPATRYVADFVGTSNLLTATRTTTPGTVDTALGPIVATAVPDGEAPLTVTSRAHAWRVARTDPGGPNSWCATIVGRAYLGWYTEFVAEVDGVRLRIWDDHAPDVAEGEQVWISVAPEDCLVVIEDD